MKTNKTELLIIGGLDPTGHAGIIRDIKVCQDYHVPYFAITTSLTCQNDETYSSSYTFNHKYYSSMLTCLKSKKITAVKIGMLCNINTVIDIVNILKLLKLKRNSLKVVWDPVLSSTSGGSLISRQGLQYALKALTPLVDVITPNAVEAHQILGSPKLPSPKTTGKILCKKYKCTVYLKGGHLKNRSTDYLCFKNRVIELKGERIEKTIRGTGCALSTSIACQLTLGKSISFACKKAKKMMQKEFDLTIA